MQNPQDGWIPLGRAVFRFGIAGTKASATSEPSAGADLFSIEAFEQSNDCDGVSKVAYEPELSTVEYLTELLRKSADASKVEIDREGGRFLFAFTLSGGGAACHGGPPWAILREPDESLELNPRLEALLNNSGLASDYEAPYAGFAKIGVDEAAEGAGQSEGVRFATGLVWRRFMLLAFDRAVKVRRVKLFARWPSTNDDFQELPSDIWPFLDVLDWEHGVARDIQGALYSSIHVADSDDDAPSISDEPTAPAYHLKIRQAVRELWPTGDMPASTKERNAAIDDWFREKGQRGPSEKTISRALK
ncbi:hypothetical protein AYJ54_36305 [Bradyrhizobium centrolobii]|uniref:Uncharacterized protein n=1 Tax=Bradyrhizobium centrolobii TaxID=1505087 RepID=A0A176Y5N1_9BRAD|nr:hypothetical protein [Bradyrhizobium centrolobii]OAE96745.1 hypothetical protein AYJ54_36305 [Bradyrhizobium centrolobii]